MSDVVRIVDSATGEAIEPCNEERARELTSRITSALGDAWDAVIDAYREGAWAALGYSSWDDYVAEEFGTHRFRLPREDRREIVGSMRDAGMSIRAIAAATGAGVGSVHRALEVAAPVPNGTPAESAEKPVPPTPITGIDGKTYAAKVTERESRSTTVETPAAVDPARQAQIDEQHYQRLTDLAPDLADRVNNGTVELRDAVAELDRRQAELDGAIRRRATRLQHLVDGWLEVPGLADLPERDQVLALLNDHDRNQVLAIEATYHKAEA